MKTIIIPQATNDSFIEVLRTLYLALQKTTVKGSYQFDLGQCHWIHPLLLLPLSAFIQATGSTVLLNGTTIQSYLQTTSFPQGAKTLVGFHLQGKNYTPITVLERSMAESQREKLETQFQHLIVQVLQSVPGTINAIYYPITELVTNIFEHSQSDRGYIFGQYYAHKEFLDICIVDTGRGLTKNYAQEKSLDFTDTEAMQAALQGHSTKPGKERGFGLRTSKDVVCKALGGSFALISGSTALLANPTDQLFSLPNFYWQGVIIAYRIPKPQQMVDITPFLE